MLANIITTINRILIPSWITGPILDKELRVSSRRRRNYVLRFMYLALLTIFISFVWLSTVRSSSFDSPAYAASRMSEAGKAIISTVIWFQFIATQLIAIIMLSTSIRDEIEHNTLGTLMTTPITSLQIVMGKVLSKLLQIFLLLAISLPILAIIRVFGGVPWNFLISSLCTTFTAVLFAGMLSLYFSIRGRKAYAVILKTIFTLGVLYAFLPFLVGILMFWNSRLGPSMNLNFFTYLSYVNPFMTLYIDTIMMIQPMIGGIPTISIPIHCTVMLIASALLLIRCITIVRKAALDNALGITNTNRKAKKRKKANNPNQPAAAATKDESIRRVSDSPILWRELRSPFIQGSRKVNYFGMAIVLIGLLITYAFALHENAMRYNDTHTMYCTLFAILAMIHNVVISATTITADKESRIWTMLLATPLTDSEILFAKALGVIRRCLPVWGLIFTHVIIFTLAGYIHPILLLHLFIIVSWIILFMTATGLYFSARLKRTTSAVVANLSLAITLWIIIPLLAGILFTEIMHENEIFETIVVNNPVVQIVVAADGGAGTNNADRSLARLRYDWPPSGPHHDVTSTTATFIITAIIHIMIAFIFAWRAKANFRKKIF